MNANANVQRSPQTGHIIFRVGHPFLFIATRGFNMGTSSVPIRKGMEILFDGQTAIVDGEEHKLPMLRGAVKSDWLVLAEEYDERNPAYNRAQRAPIRVNSSPQSGNPLAPTPAPQHFITTESDEREVMGSVNAHAHQTRTANQQWRRGQPTNAPVGHAVMSQRGLMVVEEQDGVEVPGRQFQTATKLGHFDVESNQAAQVLRAAQTAQVQPGRGLSQDEMLERMTPEQQDNYLASKEARQAQYVDTTSTPPRAPSRIASRRVEESSGFTVTTTVGSADTGLWDGDEAQVVGQVSTPSKPVARVAAVAPKAPALPPTVRLAMAKAACPDFPTNYDFALTTKKKMARILADFEDKVDVLRAIYIAEDQEMQALLFAEFPQAFAA